MNPASPAPDVPPTQEIAARAKPAASPLPPGAPLTTSYELHRLPLDSIDVPRVRIRRDLGELGGLAYSLESVGILQPIQVLKVRERYRLIAGERRLQAARVLGWTEIDALVRVRGGDELLHELVENAQRKFLTDAEEADALIRLVRDEGYQLADVAAQLGRSEAYVSKRIRVFEDPTLRSAIERDQLSVSLAEEFLTVPTERRGELLARAIEEHWDVLAVREAVRGPRTDPAIRAAALATRQVPPGEGDGPAAVSGPVVEGSFREVDIDHVTDRVPSERVPTSPSNASPPRAREFVKQLQAVRDVIRDLRPYELTPAEERALADLFQALLRLARARQQAAKGPVFPSLEQAERLARGR